MVTTQISIDHERQLVTKRYGDSTRGEAAREWRALRLLAEHAPRLAPEPVSADLDADPPVVVMSLLPGEPLGNRPLTAEQVRALALAVGQLWQSVPVSLVAPVPHEAGYREKLIRTVHRWATGRSGLSDSAAVSDSTVVRDSTEIRASTVVRDALGRGLDWLARATTLAGAARQERAWPVLPQVLGQGDASLANYLWDGERVRIVDFEDSGLSDRAFELAVLVEHVSAWRDSGLHGERFTGGFDLSTAERSWLADWRRLAALYWLLRLRRNGEPAALERQAARLLSLL